jgi:hypothetical protein
VLERYPVNRPVVLLCQRRLDGLAVQALPQLSSQMDENLATLNSIYAIGKKALRKLTEAAKVRAVDSINDVPIMELMKKEVGAFGG